MDTEALAGARALIAALRERADNTRDFFNDYDEQLVLDAAMVIELFIEAVLDGEPE